jgi:hypothetical protein
LDYLPVAEARLAAIREANPAPARESAGKVISCEKSETSEKRSSSPGCDELAWLRETALPPGPFELRPGMCVIDAERFHAAVCGDLAAGERGCRWRAALEDVNALLTLVGGGA